MALSAKKMIRSSLFVVVGASLIGITPPSYAKNIVSNGNFENGLADWTCTVTVDGDCDTGDLMTPPPPEGTYALFGYENSTAQKGSTSQPLPTMTGGIYNISFFYNTNGSPTYNSLSLQVGDLSIPIDIVQDTWKPFNSTFKASGNSTLLNFLFNTVPGSGVLFLDDVVVTQVPVPGPLPLLGAASAFGYSRKLRKRMKDGKLPITSRVP
jgi:hypothetical protein